MQARSMLHDQRKEHILQKLDEKMPDQLYKTAKNKANQTNCCICFEDFKDEASIKETSCLHIFHANCLKEWIKTKFEKPDCPTCRNEIQLMTNDQASEP